MRSYRLDLYDNKSTNNMKMTQTSSHVMRLGKAFETSQSESRLQAVSPDPHRPLSAKQNLSFYKPASQTIRRVVRVDKVTLPAITLTSAAGFVAPLIQHCTIPRPTTPQRATSDFLHYQHIPCNTTPRICRECITLKKTIKMGRKIGSTQLAINTVFDILELINPPAQRILMSSSLLYYPRLTPSERSQFNQAYKQRKKNLHVSTTKLWEEAHTRSDRITVQRVQREACTLRMAMECDDLEAQGMAFEHEEGDGHCDNQRSVCKYCINPFRLKYILLNGSYHHAMAGFIATTIKNEAYLFGVHLFKDLIVDEGVRLWLKAALPRYEDQFTSEMLEFITTHVYVTAQPEELEAQMIRSLVNQVTAGAFDNLPPINVAPIRIDVPALDSANVLIHEALGSFKNVLPARGIGLITLLSELCSDSPITSKIRGVVIYMTSFDCSGILLNSVGNRFAQSLAQVFEGMCNQVRNNEGGEYVAQGAAPFDEGAFIGTIKLILAMIPGVGTFEVQEQSQRVKKLEMIAKMVTSWDKLYQFAEKFITMAYEAACIHLYGFSGSPEDMAQAERDIQEWATQVITYYNDGGMHKVTRSEGDAEMVAGWKRIGDAYLARLLRSTKNRTNSFMSAFRTVHAMVDRMWNASAHFHKNDKLRQEPTMVYIFGKPGVGKSLLMNTTITMVMNKIDALEKRTVPFKLSKNVYIRNENEDHWNGFIPSEARVTVYDDVFQLRTEESLANVVHDIIRMQNITAFPLNMADLDSKGNTPFLSSMVFFTSNIRPARNDLAKVANSPDAILRRFTIVVEQCIKPEYANIHGHLDINKVRNDFPPRTVLINGEEKLVWDEGSFNDVYIFYQYNQTGNRIRTLTFTEYTDLIIETYLTRKKWGSITRNTIEYVEQEAHREKADKDQLQAEGKVEQGNYSYTFEKFKTRWRELTRRVRVDDELVHVQPSDAEVWEDSNDALAPEHNIIQELGATYVRAQLAGGATRAQLTEVYFNLRDYAHHRGVLLIEAHERYVAWNEKIMAQLVDGAAVFLKRVAELPLIKIGAALIGGIALIFGARRLMGATADTKAEATFSGDPRTRKHVRKLKADSGKVAEATFSGDPRTRKHVRKLKAEDSTVTLQNNNNKLDLYPTFCNGALTKDGEYGVFNEFECPEDFQDMHAEASSDPNAMALAISKLANACVDITATYECGEKTYATSMKAILIGGRLLIAPAHLLHGAPEGLRDGEITLNRGNLNRRTFDFSELTFDTTYQDSKDIVVIILPSRVPASVDLSKNFHDESSVGEYQLNEGYMFVPNVGSGYMLKYTSDLGKKEGRTNYALVDKDGAKTGVATVVNGYEYVMPTSKGECGSPIVWMNSRLQNGRILGFHVAGKTNYGFANALTRQFIESIHRKHKTIVFIQPQLDVTKSATLVANSAISETTEVNYCGVVDKKLGVRFPTKTRIKESPLHGIFPIETKPAHLCSFRAPSGEWTNPAAVAIRKMVAPPTQFPEDIAELATRHFSHTIMNLRSPYKPTILTLHQAVNGNKTEYIVPMDMHTSPGYPWILERASRKGAPSGKFSFVSSSDGVEYFVHDEVKIAVERRLACAKEGIVPFTLFVDQMKDERRPIAKVDAGKTRLFNVGPWDLNLVLRMYTSSFMAHVMYNHVHGEISVGLNPHSDEWGLIYRQFINNGTKWVGGDYGNYDKTLSYQLLMKCCDVINDWYDDGPENRLIRETLFATCFSAYHLVGREVYRVEQGNPSGIALTAIINSMVNAIMFRIVYIQNGGDITQYLDHVCVKFYGDDNIGTVSPDVEDFFNMLTLERTLASYGVEYTTPSKKAVDSQFLDPDDITYLKRSFRIECGRVYAPLALTSIREMLMWVRDSMSDQEALAANWSAATIEMFHYGRKEYNAFVDYVMRCARQRKVTLPFVTFVTSGKFWGAEDLVDVNLRGIQTDQDVKYCYQLEPETEEGYIAQSKTCASINKGRSAPVPRIVEYRTVKTSTANPQTTQETPSLQEGAPAMADDTVITRNELMSFSDTSLVTNTLPQDVPSVPPTKLDPYLKESLTQFLQRTYYYHMTWPSTLPSGALILRLHMPNYLLGIPQVWDKLKNFAYFRAGVKFGIRMNGSKFHYGSMLVSWAPMISNTGTYNTGTNNIYSAASNPSFVVSPSENEVHEFEMPYALPYPYIPLEKVNDLCFHLGCVSMYVLNPVRLAGTGTDVDFTVFMNFTDVDIAGYTPNTFTIPTQLIQDQTNFPALIPGAPVTLESPIETEELEAQGAIRRENAEARNKSREGIVSGIAETIGTVAATLSVVPAIGSFAGAVSGAAKGIAAVARYFGYSFPNSLATTTTVRKHYHNLSTTRGVNESDVLAVDPENAVGSCIELMGGKQHSTDILSIIQTPSLIAVDLIWLSAYSSGTALYTSRINPMRLTMRDTSNSYETFLSYVSRSFSYWRGSIRIHMSVVCSQMHVGRLQITWTPSTATIPAPLPNNVAASVTRIIDIEKETEVDFTIPYLRDQTWLSTNMFDASVPHDNGMITVSILNVLNYASFPIPSVAINMWVSAGADFQLARPDLTLTRYPTYNKSDFPAAEELVAQGITREMIKNADAPPLMPCTGSLEVGHTMGEVVSDLKELLMRPCQWRGADIAFGVSYTTGIMATPFGGVTNDQYIYNPNFIQYFSRIFRYSRGSFVARLIPLSDTDYTAGNQTMLLSAINHGLIGSSAVTGVLLDAQRASVSNGTVFPVIGNLFEIFRRAFGTGSALTVTRDQPLAATIPYYASQPFQHNYGNPNSPAEYVNNIVYRYGAIPAAYGTTTQGFIYTIAAADDFEMGFLVGPPVLRWNQEPPP